MRFRFVLLVLYLVVISVVGGSRTNVLDKSADLALVTTKIIKSCYGERITTIGVAGNVTNAFIASIFFGDPISIVLLKDDETSVQSEAIPPMSRYKLQMFAIMAASPSAFNSTLVHIKRSQWWNHLAQFYVIHSPDGKKVGCDEAFDFLWAAWTMDILGVKFICNHGEKGSLIYMFNPYTKFAPAPWKLVETRKGANDHPWTLFARRYRENVKICKNIDFDQTRDAGGYEVRLTITDDSVAPNVSKHELSRYPVNNYKLCMMSRYMNVIFKMVIHPRNETFGYVDQHGEGHGLVADLTNGRSDMVVRIAPLSTLPELTGSYAVYGKLFAITQYTGYPSQWEKVITSIDFPSRIGVSIVIIVTVIFLKYALRQPFAMAVLNTLRVIICNGSFTKVPTGSGPRFYLACLLCFVGVVQALYQGQLAARLSEHVRYPNVNNKRDLIKSNYILYGRETDRVVFSDAAYEGRFVRAKLPALSCIDDVLRDSSVACVGGREYLINKTLESKLHMSKNAVAEFPMRSVLRQNWPLQARHNRHFSQYLASGLYDYYSELPFREASHTLDVTENGNGDDGFRVLYVEDFDFAFIILAIGLGSAIISFVIELCFARPQVKKIARVLVAREKRCLLQNFKRKRTEGIKRKFVFSNSGLTKTHQV